jgi:hypothetical protein
VWCGSRDEGQQLVDVAGVRGQVLGHDNLMGMIDGGLRVVALQEPIASLHQAAFQVREVVLRLVAGVPGGRLGLGPRGRPGGDGPAAARLAACAARASASSAASAARIRASRSCLLAKVLLVRLGWIGTLLTGH